MGHIYSDAEFLGTKGAKALERILIDTGASLTLLPADVVDEIGGLKVPGEALELELGDGKTVKADVFAVAISLKGRKGPTLVASFKGAKAVVGVRTLEDLGFRPNPITGELDEERPAGVYYYYRLAARTKAFWELC